MARRTPKHTLGLQNNNQDTNRRNTLPNDIRKRSSGPRRNRTNYLENEEQLCLNLDLIDEVRETAETRMKRYQEKMARLYNSRVKTRQFSIGDLVL